MTSKAIFLGEAIELCYGKSLPKLTRNPNGKVPVYGSNGIAGWHNEAIVFQPTVIIGRKGSAGVVHYVGEPCYPIDTTYFTKPKNGFDINTKFLFYLLKKLDLSRLKTATGVPGLTREDAYKEQIVLPRISDQHRIVDLLSRAEGIVRLRREAQKKAAELIPAIFMEMFGEPGRNPKGWRTSPMGEICHFTSGGTPSKAREDYWIGDLPWVSPKDMKADLISESIDHVNAIVLQETTLKLIPAWTVLIVVRGMILVHTVPVAVISTPVVINQDIKAIQPTKEIRPIYLLWLLKVMHPKLLSMISTAAHGTKKLETSQLLSLKIPIPDIELQINFEEKVQRIQSIINQQAVATEKAQATFEALLGRAFEG